MRKGGEFKYIHMNNNQNNNLNNRGNNERPAGGQNNYGRNGQGPYGGPYGYGAGPQGNNYNYDHNCNQNARGADNMQGAYRPPLQPPYQAEPPVKQKSRFGLGIFVGIMIMVFAVIVAFVGINLSTRRAIQNISGDYEEKLDVISQYLEQYYIGDVDSEALTDSIASGLLSGIGDKYAEYYSEDEFKALLEQISGNYAGIGVSVVMNKDNEVEIYKVFKDSPAEKAGIKVGDIVVKADDTDHFETLDDLVAVVKGEAGTTVDITVRRSDGEHSFTIERAQVKIQTVEYKMLENKIGYIAISEFESVTVEQFENALTDLEKQGMTSVILDLRNNPGGEYDTVVAMADRVLPEGEIISTKDKAGNVKSEYSDAEHQLTIPCVVLVNGNSASASELFTGALQDYGVATIVGETTYGKGVVQSIFGLPDGSGMKFTTEKYYTPKGRDIDGVGIVPDVEVSLPEDAYEDGILEENEDTQLQKAIELLSMA